MGGAPERCAWYTIVSEWRAGRQSRWHAAVRSEKAGLPAVVGAGGRINQRSPALPGGCHRGGRNGCGGGIMASTVSFKTPVLRQRSRCAERTWP